MLQSSQLVLTVCKAWRERKSLKSESKSTKSRIKEASICANRGEKSFLNEINSVNSCKTVRNVAGLEKSWKFSKSQNHCDNDCGNLSQSLPEENKVLGNNYPATQEDGTVRFTAGINKSTWELI